MEWSLDAVLLVLVPPVVPRVFVNLQRSERDFIAPEILTRRVREICRKQGCEYHDRESEAGYHRPEVGEDDRGKSLRQPRLLGWSNRVCNKRNPEKSNA